MVETETDHRNAYAKVVCGRYAMAGAGLRCKQLPVNLRLPHVLSTEDSCLLRLLGGISLASAPNEILQMLEGLRGQMHLEHHLACMKKQFYMLGALMNLEVLDPMARDAWTLSGRAKASREGESKHIADPLRLLWEVRHKGLLGTVWVV